MAQSERIDKLLESVIQSQKTAQDNAEMLQTILVGMENLGENFKQLQENMDYWQMPENPTVEAEHQRLNEDFLKEVLCQYRSRQDQWQKVKTQLFPFPK